MPRSLAILVLLFGCSDPEPSAVIDTTPRVEVVMVAPAPESLERSLLATVNAARDALLTPMRPGKVIERSAEPGSQVSEGDALLKLDAREATANLLAARAAVLEAQAVSEDAARSETRVLALGAGASQAQRDAASVGKARANAALQRAQAQRDLAAVNLDHMTLRAPFDGEVALLDPEVGEAVGGNAPVARVVDTTTSRVVIGLLEDEVGPARAGGATFTVSAGGRAVPATLVHTAVAADPRTLDWRAELEVEGAPFAAGTPVDVRLRLPVPGGDGVLPAKAVRDGKVWVVQDGTVSEVEVEVVGETRQGLLVRGVEVGASAVLYAAQPLHAGDEVVLLEMP